MWAKNRPPPCCKHKIASFSQVFQNCGLSLPETILTLDIKDVGDRNSSAALYLFITIDEGLPHLLSQQSSDGCFARTHHSDQNDVA
jgi:hypothetical protein